MAYLIGISVIGKLSDYCSTASLMSDVINVFPCHILHRVHCKTLLPVFKILEVFVSLVQNDIFIFICWFNPGYFLPFAVRPNKIQNSMHKTKSSTNTKSSYKTKYYPE